MKPKILLGLCRRSITTYSRGFNVNGDHVVYGIIASNAIVFAGWQMSMSDYSLRRFMMHNFLLSNHRIINEKRYHTLITSTFSHMDLFHFGANMLGLYFIGTTAVAHLGVKQFLSLYFGGGLTSSLCHVFWSDVIPRSWPARYRISRHFDGLGASGALCALAAWNLLAFPSTVVYLFFIIPIPAALFGVGYILHEVSGLYYGDTGQGNAAHLGGVAFGTFYYLRKRFMTRKLPVWRR